MNHPSREVISRLLRRRAAKRLLLVAALVAGLVALAPTARRAAREWSGDEARRRARATLEQALDARVEIDEALVPSMRLVLLRGVRITRMASRPELASLVVAELELVPGGSENIAGSWSSLESLVLRDAVLTLRVPQPQHGAGTRAATPEAAELRVGRIIITNALVVIEGARGVSALRVDGEVEDWGGRPRGQLHASARRVSLRPILEDLLSPDDAARAGPLLRLIEPCCDDLAATLTLHPDGGAQVVAGLGLPAGSLSGGSVPGEAASRVRVHANVLPPEDDGGRLILASALLPGLAQAGALLRLEGADAGRALSLEALRLDSERLPRAWFDRAEFDRLDWEAARGIATLQARPDGRWDIVADAVLTGLVILPADAGARREPLGEAAVRARGIGALEPPAWDGEAVLALAGSDVLVAQGNVALRETEGADAPDDGSDMLDVDVSWRLERDALVTHGALLRLRGSLPEIIRVKSHAPLSGRLRVVPRPEGASGQAAEIRVTGARLRAGIRLASAAEVDAELRGDATWSRPGPGAPPALGAQGTIDLDALGNAAFETRFEGPSGSLDLRFEEADVGAWKVAHSGASSPALSRLFGGLGKASGAAKATWSGPSRFDVSAEGDIDSLALQSEDYTRALSLPAIPWSLQASGREQGAVNIRLHVAPPSAQLLWGGAFADLSQSPPIVDAQISLPDEGPWRAHVEARLGNILRGDADVSEAAALSGPAAEGRVRLAVDDVALAWSELQASGLLEASSRLADFAPEGALTLEARGTFAGELAVDGRLSAARGGLRDTATRLALEDVEASLPFRLERTGGSGGSVRLLPAGAEEGRGRVRADRVALLGAEARDIDVPLSVDASALKVGADVKFALLGGRAVLSQVMLRDPLSSARALEAAVELGGLRLETLGPVGPFRLAGQVGASFPHVSASATRLDVRGGARILAWGGEIVVGEISGENPWSRFPRTRVSARFSEIDLLELTTTFGFGAMSGLAEGEIAVLEMLGLTPVRLDASLRSTAREGVEQVLSLPALQNLATLATGGRAPLFDRGLMRLVKRLRYEEIGIRATLQADAFILRGLAERRGRELFLKGRLPLRVDVANAQPGAAVSFRAMMNRLRGLDGGAGGDLLPPVDAAEADADEPAEVIEIEIE